MWLSNIIWISFFILIAEGTVLKYDMGTSCGQMLTLSDTRGTSGVDVLMHMTDSLVSRRDCILRFNTLGGLGNMHFYLSEINMGDCQDASLQISTGETSTRTSLYPGLSSVCGPDARQIVNKHYVTADRFLVLSLGWSNAILVRRTVFRFIINVYTCESNCSAVDKCDNGWCVNSGLKREKTYDFCPDTLKCIKTEDDESSEEHSIVGIVFTLIAVLIFFVFCNVGFQTVSNRGRMPECLRESVECICGAGQSLVRGIRDCARGARNGIVECFRRARESLEDCPCMREAQPSTSVAAPYAPTTAETATNTVAPSQDAEIQIDTINIEDSEGAPPSYSAAMRMPKIPTAPPTYESSLDTPPDYSSVVANETFYNADK